MASDDKGLLEKIDEGATMRALLAYYVLGTDFSKVESSKDIEKLFKKVLKKRMTFQYYQAQRQYVLERLLRIKKNLNYLTLFMFLCYSLQLWRYY